MAMFEVVSLTAVGGSILAVGVFEITDSLTNLSKSARRMVGERKASPHLRLLSTSPAPSVRDEPSRLAKAA